MRSLTRIGVAVTAAALASATALAGAGVAGAEPGQPKPVFDSASSVSVSGKGTATKVSYTNKSGHDLGCFGYVGEPRLIGKLFKSTDGSFSPALQQELATAIEKGRMSFVAGRVENKATAEFGPTVGLTDKSFGPAALVVCQIGNDEVQYAEVEVTPGVGVPAGLGSLDGVLTGIGSSGSVAQTTGSLGS